MERASLVIQWLTICLTIQGTGVQFLVQEDPTCYGATNPMHHNSTTTEPPHLEPAYRNKSSPYLPHLPTHSQTKKINLKRKRSMETTEVAENQGLWSFHPGCESWLWP